MRRLAVAPEVVRPSNEMRISRKLQAERPHNLMLNCLTRAVDARAEARNLALGGCMRGLGCTLAQWPVSVAPGSPPPRSD